jgi:hypothetical protein
MTIHVPKLYRTRDGLTGQELAIVLAEGIAVDEILWCVCNRPSSLGGYLGTFRQTYRQINGFSPTGREWRNMPMRYFQAVS